jgi:transcription elongation factor
MQTENVILKNGDRVKILGGDYRDVIGIIKDVCEHEYVVNLPSQDLDETFQQQLVRAAFRPGDEVKVLDGPHTGLTGWVVDVREDGISLMNMQKNLEVREHISHPCTI